MRTSESIPLGAEGTFVKRISFQKLCSAGILPRPPYAVTRMGIST